MFYPMTTFKESNLIMKKFLSIIMTTALLICAGISVTAATPSASSVINTAAANLKKSPSVTIKFTLAQGGQKSQGNLVVAGKKFVASINGGGTTWYDGTTQWTYNPSTEEMNISSPTDEELSAINPFMVVTNLQKTYRTRMLKASAGQYAVEFTPISRGSDIKKMVLNVNSKSYAPSKVVITMSNGQVATISINSITPGKSLGTSTFQPNKKKYSNADWIDLR